MGEQHLFPEYRDENLPSRYPFSDSASLQAAAPGYALTVDMFIDAGLYPIGAAARVYISTVLVGENLVTLALSDAAGNALATASFSPSAPPTLLRFTDNYNRPAGVLVADPIQLSSLGSWPNGETTFELGATEFVASCVIPTPELGVRGILTAAGELFTGDVWLVGDNGVVVRLDDDETIRIDIVGNPLFRRQLCTPQSLFQSQNFLQTINGCPADATGNYLLTVGGHLNPSTVIRISPTPGGLRFSAVGQSLGG